MVSVIIPYMAIPPYHQLLRVCKGSINRQTIDTEIVVSECKPIEQFIPLNRLLNEGIEKATCEWVFICNADIFLPTSLMGRMWQFATQNGFEIIFPMYRGASKKMKMSDGVYLTTKSVLERFGKFDESLIGISRATFIFVKWAIENLKWYSSKQFQFWLQPGSCSSIKKRHQPTYNKCQKTCGEVIKYLKGEELWLV